MVGWTELFFFELIVMRMSGFILMNPIYGRTNVTNYVKAGIILVLSVFQFYLGVPGTLQPPGTLIELVVRLLLELGVGFVLGFVLQLCIAIVQVGGEMIDAQMGLTMAQIYDASSQASMTVTGSLLNLMLLLNFFVENGHYTLFRILLTSSQLVPYGSASLGTDVAECVIEIFLSCILLAAKLAMPILAAEVMGEMGMGILMKAIPQINAFVINLELKIIIGMALLFFFLAPINEFLLKIEVDTLASLQQILRVMAASG